MKSSISNSGLKLLSILHVFCGQHLKIPPMDRKFGKYSKLAFKIYSFFILICSTYFTTSVGYYWYHQRQNFEQVIFFASGFFGTLHCFLRIVYTTVRKAKIEAISSKIHVMLHHHNLLETDTTKFTQKLSRVIQVLVLTFFTTFAVALVSTFITSLENFDKVMEMLRENATYTGDKNFITQVYYETWKSVWSNNKYFNIPDAALRSYIKVTSIFIYVLCYLAIGRLVVSDVLIYSWYSTIVNQYQQLADSLPQVMAAGEDLKKVQYWIRYHSLLNELLNEINSFAAPVVLVAVVFTGIKISMCSFVIFKLHEELSIVPFIAFGVTSMQQVLVYCVLGQKIRNNIAMIHKKGYRCPWTGHEHEKKKAALMICMAVSEKAGHKLPGAPFFSMSLHFFASMASVVFTYFVVLIQIIN
ncbi:uncharacterized protein LOC132197401 [Neocloeon triangulifer]|uniref:uncharacterized protein LOC132197401 n=1 Tax=Neocloeon triangulifer TaxID=2078957 RepID=UPI00286FAE01|nr:uncharacterized protein LOC132197401 [Neocloeon triangulifer]